MKKYQIDYKGLNSGEHSFEFAINDELFGSYEDCEVLGGDCVARIELLRGETMLQLEVEIEGAVKVECDRCLEPCEVEVDFVAPLVVKFTDEDFAPEEFDGELLWLPRSETTLDLSHYLYESILLSLPYQRVHEDGGCNGEMTSRFSIVSNEEFEAMEKEAERVASEGEATGLAQSEMSKLQMLKEKMEQEK